MPILTPFQLPSMAESEHNRSFRTHAGYQQAFRVLALGAALQRRSQRLEALAQRALAAYGAHLVQSPAGAADLDVVRACLRRAWGAETILCVTSELSPDPEMVRLALAWGSVQTYYACYATTQAALVAEGKERSEHHNTTQRQVADLWVNRRFTLEPWSLAAVEPGTRMACSSGFLNGPGRPLDLGVHPWAGMTAGQEWDLAGVALKNTRQQRVKEALKKAREQKQRVQVKAWKEEEARRVAAGKRARKVPIPTLPRLTDAEKRGARHGVRPFTMLDYLFRLRIKANYLDDDMFSEGPDSDHAAEAFARGMQEIVAATCLVHELRIGRVLGPAWVLAEADAWLDAHTGAPADAGLAERRSLLAAA